MEIKNEELKIERRKIKFHPLGTLKSLTQWVNRHEDGYPELIKNVRAVYSRLKLDEKYKVALLLFKDKDKNGPARLGLLDVGGATKEDLDRWSLWQDPEASARGEEKEEETQGNGGKAYMYKLFEGSAYIMGIKDNLKNCMGYIGQRSSQERGEEGYIPDKKTAENFKISRWEDELLSELQKFGTDIASIPTSVRDAIYDRKSFTIIVGEDPIDWENKDIKMFLKRIIRQPQSTLAIEQVKYYVIHNGKLLLKGSQMELETIEPHPQFKKPLIYEIPGILTTREGNQVNTTKSSSGKHQVGRIILYTSKENMAASYATLKPRWVVTYKTKFEVVGQKTIQEVISTPGTHFIYATVDLDALSPDYVDLGRKRPNPGPLIDAVDKFLSEKIWELAKQINDLNKEDLNKSFLDEIQKENNFLNELKNQFLPKGGSLEVTDLEGEEGTGTKIQKTHKPVKWGKEAHKIETQIYAFKMGTDVTVNLRALLKPAAKDINNNSLHSPSWEWKSDNQEVIVIDNEGNCTAKSKGNCRVWVSLKNSPVISSPIEVEVWKIKEIILSPRTLQIPTGQIRLITSQVTNDEGDKSSEVLLKWGHDSEDQRLIKISPKGYVFGNVVGKTNVFAEACIMCTNPCEVEIVKGENADGKGSGFPQLLMTEKDIDPFTHELRPSDPEAAALWQESWDIQNNVWWLNLQSKDAAFAYNHRAENPNLWRMFHAKILVEMMIQVHMQEEYTKREQKPGLWSDHKYFYDRKYVELSQAMWEKLSKYVDYGIGEE